MERLLKSRLACLAFALLTFAAGASLELYANLAVPVYAGDYYRLVEESGRCRH